MANLFHVLTRRRVNLDIKRKWNNNKHGLRAIVLPMTSLERKTSFNPIFCSTLSREHSPLGEVSLYTWSPGLPVWTQLVHYIVKIIHFLFWSNPILLNWKRALTVILPAMVSFLCSELHGFVPYQVLVNFVIQLLPDLKQLNRN